MTTEDMNEMYDNVSCPKCGGRAECEDLRRTGNYTPDSTIKAHKERVAAYRKWKAAKP